MKDNTARLPFLFFISFEILIAIFSVLIEGVSLEALHVITRYSGRLSLLFLSLLLISRDHHQIRKWISPDPFLLFALLHGIHLIELAFFIKLSGNALIPVRLAGGFLAYLLIFAMPVVQRTMHNAGPFIQRFENFYLVYVWFIFFMSYLPRVLGKLPNVGGSYPEFVFLFIWVITLAIYKIALVKKYIPARNP
jgi:hypothetical protein